MAAATKNQRSVTTIGLLRSLSSRFNVVSLALCLLFFLAFLSPALATATDSDKPKAKGKGKGASVNKGVMFPGGTPLSPTEILSSHTAARSKYVLKATAPLTASQAGPSSNAGSGASAATTPAPAATDPAHERFRAREDLVAAEYYASTTVKSWGKSNSPLWDGHSYTLVENDVPETDKVPLAARYSPETDCRVCTMWIHAAVAWLPAEDEFTPAEVQSTLRHACNDTWIIHDTDLTLERTKVDDAPGVAAERSWGHKPRCERMFREDRGQEALHTIWTMWDHLQPVGGLPNAVCCRLNYCPCPAIEDSKKDKFWTGVPSLVSPMYIR